MPDPTTAGDAPSIRVLLCDDQRLIRQGLRLLLDNESGISIVGEAADGEEALTQAQILQPSVILMDIRMPRLDGVRATSRLRDSLPDCHVLVLTTYADDELVLAALRAGAKGYLLKDADAADLMAAIHAVHRGGVWLQTPEAASLLTRLATNATTPAATPTQPAPASAPSGLTLRELDVVRLIAQGHDNHQIAARLVVSEATVKTHINNIFSKLGVTDRGQVVAFAYKRGLIKA
jgi:DNA-binding NarL/FixJ family response regulator